MKVIVTCVVLCYTEENIYFGGVAGGEFRKNGKFNFSK